MCGIAGFIDIRRCGRDEAGTLAVAMHEAMQRRGPDGHGVWIENEKAAPTVALAHRRLSILDLTDAGAQPFIPKNKRGALTFNGEIYNFQELRDDLTAQGVKFKGHSDTEILAEALSRWGVAATLPRLSGMFAFGWWDRETKRLTLARDHMGKKPLYYGWVGDRFAFASELKALRALPDFSPEIERGALGLYSRYGYIPSPWSIYRGIFKLPAASTITLDFTGHVPRGQALSNKAERYWSLADIADAGERNPLKGDAAYMKAKLADVLEQAVKRRMVSDVPLGAFLSGGIDSSLIVALMQKNSAAPIKTYSIGFNESGFDESEQAAAVAKHLGTDHHRFTVTPDEARSVIPQLPEIYDEPFADMSQIPTYHVCRLARQDVTVALSGDGGDETFGGYDRYFWVDGPLGGMMALPLPLRRALAGGILSLSPEMLDRMVDRTAPLLDKFMNHRITGDRMHRAARLIRLRRHDRMYRALLSHRQKPKELVIGGWEPRAPLTDPALNPALKEPRHRMMLADCQGYLPDDILTKVDRASMAVSLEARAPLLDKEVIELAWQLPLEVKAHGHKGKRILRSVLTDYVPEELFERPKEGFRIPMADWLRGPLKEWAGDLLSQTTLRRHGLFYEEPVTDMWNAHLSGRADYNFMLWDILMAQAWAERWMS